MWLTPLSSLVFARLKFIIFALICTPLVCFKYCKFYTHYYKRNKAGKILRNFSTLIRYSDEHIHISQAYLRELSRIEGGHINYYSVLYSEHLVRINISLLNLVRRLICCFTLLSVKPVVVVVVVVVVVWVGLQYDCGIKFVD